MASHTFLVVLLVCAVSSRGVDSHNCEGANALRAVEFDLTPATQEGYYLTQIDGTVLCGHIDGASAARACWDLGVNEGEDPTSRKCRCAQISDGEGGSVADLAEDVSYMHLDMGGLNGLTCGPGMGDPNCLFSCASTEGEGAYEGASAATLCGGSIDYLAVVCEDIDECQDGALVDCTGPFEHDCVKTYPCGPHATCADTVGSWTCTCSDPYNGVGSDGYDLEDGCLDTDECELATRCGRDNSPVHTHCVNTPGSYTCWCDAGFVYNGAQGCTAMNCAANPPAIANVVLAGWTGPSAYGAEQTTECADGFEATVSNPSGEITTECRLDGKWCQCNSVTCQRKKCEELPFDGNAKTAVVDGVTTDVVIYTCEDGFESNGNPGYSLTCPNSGIWPLPTHLCTDENECNRANPCGVDGYYDCYNTIGSYHCICHLGYEGPNCDHKVSCGRIPDVANSYRVTEIGEVYSELDMVVAYECEEGFRASSKHNPHDIEHGFDIKCKLDKCWSPDPIPECVPISCGDPGIVVHASRYGHSFFYKDKVSYTCYDGFEPSDYAVLDSSSYKTFYITCEHDEWTRKSHCVDVNECEELQYPCGTSTGHHICINLNGTYTCSCAYGYQLDNNGHECIKVEEPEEEPEVNPCLVFNTFGFCNGGTCELEAEKKPHCRCAPGFDGPFCDQQDEAALSIPFLLSAVGTTLSVFSMIVCTVLACYVCGRHCGRNHADYSRHADVHADIHADVHHDVHVSGKGFRKPALPFVTRFRPFSM